MPLLYHIGNKAGHARAALGRLVVRARVPLRPEGETPVSNMRGFWGLVTAYWTSERWLEAWSLTAAVIAMTTLLSKSSVWVAMASADFLGALVNVHASAAGDAPLVAILTAAGVYGAIALSRIGGIGIRHFFSTTLHRKARGWTQERFQAAMLARGQVALNLTSDRAGDGDGDPTSTIARLPDNIDQRVDVCTTGVFGATIGLVMGLWGSVASIYFVSEALIERSAPVPVLDRWAFDLKQWLGDTFGPAFAVDLAPGGYGSAVLAAVLIVVYVPLMTFAAYRLGRVLERQTIARQKADGTWRGEMTQMLGRAPRMAISRGERVQARLNARLYGGIDRTWHRLNGTESAFLSFTQGTQFLTMRLLGYLPALPAYLSGTMTFKTYAAGSELVAELINDCSWFVQVMPALATLKANTGRLTELAEAIERVGDSASFYRETGRYDFAYREQDPALGLTIKHLALCHRGHDAEPFIRAHALTVRPGRWAYVRGQNGAGKSCLLKAIMGLWPYGEGEIALPKGVDAFFAGQDPDLPERLTLKELVTYPHMAEDFDDLKVAAALGEAGLARFVPHLGETLMGGKSWANVFSGGQKQRLVLARILLQRPGLLMLDEAPSAMDPDATLDFHRLLKEHLPRAIVVSVMHEHEPPISPEGVPFYTDLLVIEDGIARIEPAPELPLRRIAAE
ncbi:MAG: ATP-binding cassette domain-containing protein [Paracoccaceae bacterium]